MQELTLNTGVKELRVNGVSSIKFNPSDIGFLERIYALIGKLEKIEEETAQKRAKAENTAKIFDYFQASDKKQREAVDSIFGDGFCDAVFSGVRLMAMADGLTLIENFLYSVIDLMDDGLTDNLAQRNDRLSKYTAKYEKYHKKTEKA